VMVAVFSYKQPFDSDHPKRVFIIHTENVTSGEHSLHMAAADAAPKFSDLVQRVAQHIQNDGILNSSVLPLSTVAMHDHNGDWDVLYPFSAFLTPYKIPLLVQTDHGSPYTFPPPEGSQFHIRIVNETRDIRHRSRKLELEVHHPGLIWPVLAFDAHVLSWSVDDNPQGEFARHFIKAGSFYGVHSYNLSLEVQSGDNESIEAPLLINFIGIREDAMYPGKQVDAKESSLDGALSHPMNLLERLDGYLNREMDSAVDSLLMGCIAGVVRV